MSLLTHTPIASRRSPLFHRTGLTYFWFLNDACEESTLRRHAIAYAQAGVSAVCLHARLGLLFPYGGDAWFSMIRGIVEHCAQLGMEVWLYDEDPYPSGNAGGRLLMDHPQHQGHAIEMDQADLSTCTDGLFAFKPGRLLWCGVIDERGWPVADLTGQVGVVRRRWEVLDPWDSRWYYPATPLYDSPRSFTKDPELALKLPSLKPGHRLVAFTARPTGASSPWGGLVDTLSLQATELFIQYTHERYSQALGDHFGSTITTIFTDEAKFHARIPWTPGLFEDFQSRFGYDLRQRLVHLFENTPAPGIPADDACLTRLQYRQWCGRRFRDAWMKPVAKWCHDHGLNLVGHLSPEDDPVEQSAGLTNLFPLQRHFTLAGLDLIIPAVGDRRHGIINLGVLGALSVQQQQGMPGVMSEMLGVFGLGMTPATAWRVILWQTMMGVTTPVIHGGFNSVQGDRRIDAPPDSGPDSPIWPDMVRINQRIAPVQEVIRSSVNIAPVAILWPIRSFNAQAPRWQAEPGGLRGELIDLVSLCLDHQIGIHLLDEADLWQAAITPHGLQVGQAMYQHVLVPSCTVLHARTIDKLKACLAGSIAVQAVGQLPDRVEEDHRLVPPAGTWCRPCAPDQAIAALPRLLDLPGDATDIRCTAWLRDGVVTRLVMNLRGEPYAFTHQGQTITLDPDACKTIVDAD